MMNIERRILGIDPGSRVTGFGIVAQSPHGALECIAGGCVRLSSPDMPTRLGLIFEHIQELVKYYKPTELAIEQVFVHKNVRSALKLGQVRGVVIAAVMMAKLPVFEYAPRQIKQAVVGKGQAEKGQIQHMMQKLLGLSEKPQSDCADALAAALCHLHTLSFPASGSVKRKQTRKQWEQYDRAITR